MENLGNAIGLLIWITLVPALIALALRSRHEADDAPAGDAADTPPRTITRTSSRSPHPPR